MLKVIGKGSFGKVLLGKHIKTHRVFAIKVLSKEAIVKQNEAKHIMSERNVLLKNRDHPFLVGLYYSFQTPAKLYFVLDYVNGGELFFHLQREKRFSVPRALFYAAEITSALTFMHSHDVVYRDLKPENILLDSKGHVVLTDFGLCKENVKPGGTTSTFCGTPEYLAPEVLKKHAYGRSVDWWCLGCVTYEMMCGLPPFYSRDCSEMYDRILHAPLRFPEIVPPLARSLLEGLLVRIPDQRLGGTAADADEIKAHPFFAAIDWVSAAAGTLLCNPSDPPGPQAALDRREIPPPFNPGVADHMDLHNFDPQFTVRSQRNCVCLCWGGGGHPPAAAAGRASACQRAAGGRTHRRRRCFGGGWRFQRLLLPGERGAGNRGGSLNPLRTAPPQKPSNPGRCHPRFLAFSPSSRWQSGLALLLCLLTAGIQLDSACSSTVAMQTGPSARRVLRWQASSRCSQWKRGRASRCPDGPRTRWRRWPSSTTVPGAMAGPSST